MYLTGVIEYLIAELCELSADVARDDKRARIQSNHILKAMRLDREFDELTQNVIIPDGGICVKVIIWFVASNMLLITFKVFRVKA